MLFRSSWRLSLRRPSSEWRRPAEGADSVYIVHPDFAGELAPLVEWRRAQGLRVAVVTTDAAADAFNFGRDEPEAIRQLLAWACAHWPAPAPAYAVLVGDASAEPKTTGPAYARNFVSTYYGPGEDAPANDDGFATFLAGSPLPQLMVGRLSVNAPGQLGAIVEKILAHERASTSSRRRLQVGQVANLPSTSSRRRLQVGQVANLPSTSSHRWLQNPDPPSHGGGYKDIRLLTAAATKTSAFSRRRLQKLLTAAATKTPHGGGYKDCWRGRLLLLADIGYERLFDPGLTRFIPAHLDVARIDVRDFPVVDHYNLEHTKISPAGREAVLGAIDEGAAIVHYAGHGGISLISHAKVLFWTDVARLANAGRLPLFVQVSCRTGGFDWPEQEWNACLSELLLRRPEAGALGVLAAGRAIIGDEPFLQQLLFRAYRGAPALGEVRLLMKAPYLLLRPERDFIDSYNLLGDPASRLILPEPFERLEIEPKALEAGSGREIRVRGAFGDRVGAHEGRESAGVQRIDPAAEAPATVTLWWRDPAGRTFEAGSTAPQAGGFSTVLRLPDGPRPGRWSLAAWAATNGPATGGFQSVAHLDVSAPQRTYPDDPGGTPDLAFVENAFAFVTEELTDGETIQAVAAIENRGTARAQPARLSWSIQRPNERQGAVQVAGADIPALAATERTTITLRWDPFDTAGEIENSLRITPAPGEKEIVNNTALRTLRIRTKPDLALAGAPVWQRQGREVRLALAASNAGETPARDVQAVLSLGDSAGPRFALGRPLPIAERLDGGAQSQAVKAIALLPESPGGMDYIYIELGTAEPVSEMDKRNNRYRFALSSTPKQ